MGSFRHSSAAAAAAACGKARCRCPLIVVRAQPQPSFLLQGKVSGNESPSSRGLDTASNRAEVAVTRGRTGSAVSRTHRGHWAPEQFSATQKVEHSNTA